jgi:hypothetical protein
MKQAIRIVMAVTLGVSTVLFGQLAIENSAWWLTGGTATFDDPLLNAIKFGVAGSCGLAAGLMIGLRPLRRRRLL